MQTSGIVVGKSAEIEMEIFVMGGGKISSD